MAVNRTKALILRHTPEREHDRLLTVLTPAMGQQRLRARGTKKSVSKLGGSLEPLTEVDLQFADGRTMGLVTGSIILNRFPGLRDDLIALVSAQWLMELVERLTKPDQPEQGLYDIIIGHLQAMEGEHDWTAGRRWLALYRRAWQIIAHEGFAASLESCAICHQSLESSDSVTYIPETGFVHPPEASVGLPAISQSTRSFLLQGITVDDERRTFRELHAVMERLIQHTLDRPMKSETVLRAAIRLNRLSAS